MADFGSTGISLVYNTGTDASPTWTGGALNTGGSSGANELRWATSGATTTTTSANWPYITRPASGTNAISQMWAFTADAVGLQVATYTGDNTKSNVVRWSWDTSGTMNSAPQFSLFNSTSHTAPTTDNSIAGGNNTDTGSSGGATVGYVKINAWGSLLATTGTNLTAASAGTLPTATTGTAGSVVTTSANWLNTNGAWQSASGWVQYITFGSTPAATTANTWPWTCILFVGANSGTGTLTPVFTMQYTFV